MVEDNGRVTLTTLLVEQKAMHLDIAKIIGTLEARDVRLRLVETDIARLEARLSLWAVGLLAFTTVTSAIAAYLGSVFGG